MSNPNPNQRRGDPAGKVYFECNFPGQQLFISKPGRADGHFVEVIAKNGNYEHILIKKNAKNSQFLKFQGQ